MIIWIKEKNPKIVSVVDYIPDERERNDDGRDEEREDARASDPTWPRPARYRNTASLNSISDLTSPLQRHS